MASTQTQFHMFFLPYIVPGHMIPCLDLARLFATRGIKCTIVTTPLKIPFFAEAIKIDNQKLGIDINLLSLKFPYEEPGFPKECKSTENSFKAIAELQYPFGVLMEEFHPNCLVADFQFPWASSVAKEFGVPCLSFDVCSYIYPCVSSNLNRYQPHKEVSSDSEHFVVPGLPHEIKLRRADLAPYEKGESEKWMIELVDRIWEGQRECYGVIKNSFYELEPDYADYYQNSMGLKHWHIGPLFLYFEGKGNECNQMGKKSSIDVEECLRWLDEKQDNSAIYICFGSMSNVAHPQLDEIARALESLAQNFILVVRNKEDTHGWVLDGFEDRVKGRGLVIRGWAPQRLILEHQAVGGFVTHCGWNSILEGVVAGLPMVTWPRHAEQFYNEKLVTDVLRIGVPVGVEGWAGALGENGDVIGKGEIVKAISTIMVGKEAEDIRKRAQELKKMARGAIQEGGSSYSDLATLIEELKAYKIQMPGYLE